MKLLIKDYSFSSFLRDDFNGKPKLFSEDPFHVSCVLRAPPRVPCDLLIVLREVKHKDTMHHYNGHFFKEVLKRQKFCTQ
jgi:hypothetical protein